VNAGTKLSTGILMLSLLALVTVSMPAATAQSQSGGHFTVTVTGQSLTAGFNNTVAISMQNNFYSALYDTDIVVSIPTPLSLIGDDHWHYDSIALGKTVNIGFQVYAPTSAIGSSYQASLTATYKQLGDISSTQESHSLSFSVYGWINMIIYGVQLSPSSVAPGGNATISGNVLNSGNLAAYNATATVESEALIPTSLSSAFVGEVDPNIPRPFSLLLKFKPNLSDGNYSITVKVTSIDNSRPGIPIITQQAAKIQIKKPAQQPVQRQQPTGLMEIIIQTLRNLFNAFFGSLTGIITPFRWTAIDYSYAKLVAESTFNTATTR
jgi:uncharacterized membrane protein